MAGGPSASNPEPLAPFVDVFFMGEAEEGLIAILDVLGRCTTRRVRCGSRLPLLRLSLSFGLFPCIGRSLLLLRALRLL